MRTLIVPCAGRSSRFPNMKPKWLLVYPDGEIMVKKAISGLELKKFDRIIITIVKDHAEQFDAVTVLTQAFDVNKNSKYEILVLDEFTSCQAETVYLTLERRNVIGEFAVKDSDNYIGVKVPKFSDYVVGLNINSFEKEIYRLKSKSYLVLNEQGNIIDIIEKNIKSELICIGLYGFGDAGKFKKAYEHLRGNNHDKHEMYLSHIISYLIGMKLSVYKCVETLDYEDWGTIADWSTVMNQYATYIINADGILFEKCDKYGKDNWHNNLVKKDQNLDYLKQLSDMGSQLIITTERDVKCRKQIIDTLNSYGIKVHAVIPGCNQAPQILINTFYNAKPYPAAKAINLGLEDDLGRYLNQ